MATLKYLGSTITADKAIKGPDFVRMVMADGTSIFSACKVSDFSDFVLTEGSWETSYVERKHSYMASAYVSDGYLVLSIDGEVDNGTIIEFIAPCDCLTVTEGLKVGDVTYAIVDALGSPVIGVRGAWSPDAIVAVALNTDNNSAYVVNGNETKTCATALTPSGWGTDNTQVAAALGVTATNNVDVSPRPDCLKAYVKAGVYCSAQGNGSLTFTCDKKPTDILYVNVKITGV